MKTPTIEIKAAGCAKNHVWSLTFRNKALNVVVNWVYNDEDTMLDDANQLAAEDHIELLHSGLAMVKDA